MELSRRDFLKLGAAASVGAVASTFGFDIGPAVAATRRLKIARTTEVRSTCPYCSVSCGVIIHTLGDNAKNVKPSVVHIEGDPDHPINRGTLCPKGITLRQFVLNDHRLTKPRYRAPGSSEWTDIGWEEAIEKIARRIKETRDRTFVTRDEKGRVVNRTSGIAVIGGCTDTNEMNYLIVKTARSLGVTYLDNQARI